MTHRLPKTSLDRKSPEDEDKELRFESTWFGTDRLRQEWEGIDSILKSRHNQIWQARVLWILTIAGFIALAAQELLDITLSIWFVSLFTFFMILVDTKYQLIKQKLYRRVLRLEKYLGFNVYGQFAKESDKPVYAVVLWAILLMAIVVWLSVAFLG